MQTQTTTNSNPTNKEAYRQKVQAEFDKLTAQIDELKAKAAQAEADTKLQYQSHLENLRVKQEAMQNKLEEFQKSGEAAWEELQSGLEKVWQDLEETFQNAVGKFQLDTNKSDTEQQSQLESQSR